ncbi:hypothetical protein ACJJIX_01850 [Microbulbifer sp. VAAC004]|uniref:hypothetical protein n=1 Tax=unclassified Microbulbifer TaxID=2619833 RepID=UPI004039385E
MRVFIVIASLLLASCTYFYNIKSQYDEQSRLEFSVEPDGWLFKTQKAVGRVSVHYSEGANNVVVWELSADYSSGNANWPSPGFIKYGVVPEGLHEVAPAKELVPGIEYTVSISGPGYIAEGKVRAKNI